MVCSGQVSGGVRGIKICVLSNSVGLLKRNYQLKFLQFYSKEMFCSPFFSVLSAFALSSYISILVFHVLIASISIQSSYLIISNSYRSFLLAI